MIREVEIFSVLYFFFIIASILVNSNYTGKRFINAIKNSINVAIGIAKGNN